MWYWVWILLTVNHHRLYLSKHCLILSPCFHRWIRLAAPPNGRLTTPYRPTPAFCTVKVNTPRTKLTPSQRERWTVERQSPSRPRKGSLFLHITYSYSTWGPGLNRHHSGLAELSKSQRPPLPVLPRSAPLQWHQEIWSLPRKWAPFDLFYIFYIFYLFWFQANTREVLVYKCLVSLFPSVCKSAPIHPSFAGAFTRT